jgi:hypothetical protein
MEIDFKKSDTNFIWFLQIVQMICCLALTLELFELLAFLSLKNGKASSCGRKMDC